MRGEQRGEWAGGQHLTYSHNRVPHISSIEMWVRRVAYHFPRVATGMTTDGRIFILGNRWDASFRSRVARTSADKWLRAAVLLDTHCMLLPTARVTDSFHRTNRG